MPEYSEQVNNSQPTSLLEIVEGLQTIWSLIALAVLIIVFVAVVIRFTKRVNNESAKQVAFFKDNKKYIPSLYIELNETKENLRYFANGDKWKSRIKAKLTSLLRTHNAKEMKRQLSRIKTFHIPLFCTKERLTILLDDFFDYFDTISRKDYEDSLGDYYFVLERLSYYYKKFLGKLKSYNLVMNSKSILLVGSAGNGKTNLLCDFVNMVMKTGNACIFINAKNISDSCTECFWDALNLPDMIKDHGKLYIFLINKLLFLKRKFLFIVIDALNENDNLQFKNTLSELTDLLYKYSRIKVLYSCRSEYFELRYKRFFDQCNHPPYVFNIKGTDYDDRAKTKMLITYKEYFKVTGSIAKTVQLKLFRSLILMRIFFEVNANRNVNIIELHYADLYKRYIDIIIADNPEIDLESILHTIVNTMLATNEYESIELKQLDLPQKIETAFKGILDDNILISKTINVDDGLITEEHKELVYFVFDELRDYCIARYKLLDCKKIDNYDSFFNLADKLFENEMSPLEGILKYAYYYFKKIKRYDLCKEILYKYNDKPIYLWKHRHHRLYDEHDQTFYDNGLSLIFSNLDIVENYEFEYICGVVQTNPNEFWHIFFYLLISDLDLISPNTKIALDILLRIQQYNNLEKIIECIARDRDYYSLYENEDRMIHQLNRSLNYIYKEHGDIPDHLKYICLIIYSICPYEDLLEDHIESILKNTKTYDQIYSQVINPELKDQLSAMFKRFKKSSQPGISLQELLAEAFSERMGTIDNEY